MSWYQDLSFRWKISLPLVLICAIFTFSSVLGIVMSANMAKDTDKVGHVFLKQIDYLLQADRDLYQAIMAERALVYIDGSSTTSLDDHESNAGQVKERIGKALALGELNKPEEYKDQFESHYSKWYGASSQVVRYVQNGDVQRAITLSQGESQDAFDQLRDLIDVIQEQQIEKSEFYTSQALERNKAARQQLILSLIAGLAISIIMVVFVPPLIIRTINFVSDSVESIASGDGDLTARIPVNSRDELGDLAGKFNVFMEKLHALIVNTKQCAERVSDSSAKLSDISDGNKSALAEQKIALDMVVTAVTEMSSAITEVSQNTSQTAMQATSAKDRSAKGLETVNNTVNQIELVSEQVGSVSALISQVESQVNDVTSVLDVINGVAEQTNLLALNAAIEAARAGEQGRGFAVVADEVRTLASRTQQSTTDIQQMLDQLQNGVEQAVEAMKSSSEAARSTVTVANEAGDALKEIDASVDQIANMSIQIATAVEQQSAVIDEINKNLVLINDQAITTSENAEMTLNASEGLDADSAELMHNVGSFKL